VALPLSLLAQAGVLHPSSPLPLLPTTTTAATTTAATIPIFEAINSTYAADTIQIKKLDADGNTLGITKINEDSDITIDTEIFLFESRFLKCN
jgi:hypothetical protein